MTEKEFLTKLIEYVNYSEYEDKKELLKVLKESYILFDKTSDFTRKDWQSWEYVELRVPIPIISKAEIYKKYLGKICAEIYIETKEYDFGGMFIKPGNSTITSEEEKLQMIHFEDIQEQIIEQIKQAKYTIWVAVAWFTDEVLFKELLNKKNEGLNIQIIIIDDEINKNYGCKYEENFETYRLKKDGYFENIMHNKFCIIDLKTVIHGSYNWTKKARYNKETISIDTDRTIADKFADEFIKLKS
ncbi:MAG: phospholipase D-like domain-containing protein [Clostridium sp.]|uniref:phospholipase D-like domain-containing protein n=1 Tax=Clostridium sp. TaxID=1506 RepID=UPI003D6D1AF0